MTNWFKRKARGVKVFVFGRLGKNPYPAGSPGSYWWKKERGEPLTADEDRQKDQFEADAQLLQRAEETLQSAGAVLSRFDVLHGVLDNLPRVIRKDLYDTEAPEEFIAKLEQLLMLASHRRERTAIRLAFWALAIGSITVLISVATLAVAVWTLNTSGGC